MNIILLGGPGSGQGTQSKKIAEKFNLFYLETGDLSREWAEKDNRINNIISKGELIPENEMTEYVLNYLEGHVSMFNNILFEGFPRFLSQYISLEEYLRSKNSGIDNIIYLKVSDEEIIKRLSSRRTCKKCDAVFNMITNPPPTESNCTCGGELFQRTDDNPQSLKIRLKEFKENSLPIINYIKDNNKFIQINGEQPIEKIFEDILNGLEVK